MYLRRISLFIVLILLAFQMSQSQTTGKYTADWNSLRQYNCPEWYKDAKFGIFIHWGPYSVPAYYSEKYPKTMYSSTIRHKESGELVLDYHKRTWGEQSEFGYKDFIPMFTAEKFSATEWTGLFKAAGAGYVVLVGEHHDGFAMYHSMHTKWNCVNMGPKRDVAAEIRDACYENKLKFGLSSHFANHWRYYAYEDGFDTMDPENSELYGKPHDRNAEPDEDFKDWWWKRTTDIIDNYQPDLLWFDYFFDQPAFSGLHPKIAAYYYNKGLEWDKGLVLNDKNMRYPSFPEEVIVLDIERGKLDGIRKYPWQTDTSIGENSWGYIRDWKSRSANSLVDDLVDIVSKNGNLLLNVGPKADGTIPDDQAEVLKQIGSWLSVNGEAIYGTRPWVVYGEGETRIDTGHHSESKESPYKSGDIRFTQKGNILYAILLAAPAPEFVIKSLGKEAGLVGGGPESVTLLGENVKVIWKQEKDGLKIKIEGKINGSYAFVIKMEGSKINDSRQLSRK